MKAIRFGDYGGPEQLRLDDVDEPHAGPGEIRIAVRAAGVNGIDWKLRAGYMRDAMPLTFPAGTGMDAAGVVDEVGPDVDGVAIGDEVFGGGNDTFAEHAVLADWAPKPAGLSFEEAAGYPIPVETALRILDAAGVTSGHTLVVSGAAGGVGSAVVQFARQRGATVIGTASAGNQDYLTSLGAVATTYDDGWADRVRELAPQGVDAAIDIAGAGVLEQLVALTGDPGRVVTIADFSGSVPGVVVSSRPVDKAAAYADAARQFEAGTFGLTVERTYPLVDAGEAQKQSAAGHVRGRLVVTVP